MTERTSSRSSDLFPDEVLAPTAALLRAQIAVGAALDRLAVEPVGLEPAIADLLVRLSKAPNEGLRGVDIAEQLLINPTRASRLVDRAEAAGLVERKTHPEDRRAQNISLSSAGIQKAAEFAPLMSSVLHEAVIGSFTRDELETLIGLLDRVTDGALALLEETA